ncbi:MAG: tRNA (guanosine(46)-N7)-methyltransferase TrmB [Mastigocoleus sp.]
MAAVRVRQHVNPLSNKYQISLQGLEWEKIYTNPHQPLLLDIGCARGKFLLSMAQLQPEWNFLGLEIREPLVTDAYQWRDKLNLTNLHYLFSNTNNPLQELLASLPNHVLQYITIQFPDPWFKKRHAKRRMVQPQLVTEIAEFLIPGGTVFLQSDIEFLAQEMCDRFTENSAFFREGDGEWLKENPLPVQTEREIATFNKEEPVFRAVYKRKLD